MRRFISRRSLAISEPSRLLLGQALEAQDYVVAMAEDGRAALELLRAQGPPAFDVVLLDLLMPEIDGYQASPSSTATGSAWSRLAAGVRRSIGNITSRGAINHIGGCMNMGGPSASARPMPRPPPVTTAGRPLRST